MRLTSLLLSALLLCSFKQQDKTWIRHNLLGYQPGGIKIAVWCSKGDDTPEGFELVNSKTNQVAFQNKAGKPLGPYGPFTQTCRLDFSDFRGSGHFFLRAGNATSLAFEIRDDIYQGTADFSLQYMRQQRSGFNPFLKDSCHTQDGYTMYGPMPDSTHVDVSGGWHDATDYLQYAMTSANATYHLLAAHRDFPSVFADRHLANGLNGSNSTPDILDEAKWGLDWLLKMHPQPDWLFNQLADDRDHVGFRLPSDDKANYGKGKERPVYFVTGEPQGLSKYKNKTTGTSSTAAKFSSAFALGYQAFGKTDLPFANLLKTRAHSAYEFGLKKPGNTQTACYLSPYFYEEDNWVDDMELAAAQLYTLTGNKKYAQAAYEYAQQEKQTPWLGKDSANHYQWYPFINIGHYELAKIADPKTKKSLIKFYHDGIESVYKKGVQNAFLRGVPFIWCSNNLQASFAIQCYWYRQLSGDESYAPMEQAAFDWLLGCNPWGTSMIVGMPAHGDTPEDAHSSLTILKGYQTLGSLVDGPVYGSIYKQQRGVTIVHGDEYAEFQSDHVVYHDDYGDYVTNEPTMDGTASLIYLLAAKEDEKPGRNKKAVIDQYGAVIRGDTTQKQIALVFTGDSFADGGEMIASTLQRKKIKASFFFTGNFYRNSKFESLIKNLKTSGHYLGAHSDKHLLYCDWAKRDSLLVTHQQFSSDLNANYDEMQRFGITRKEARYFLPPYEWYNDSISTWTKNEGLQLVNFSPGTKSPADYTTPDMTNYRSSEAIWNSIIHFEKNNEMNGFILLLHIGTDPKRTDKFYLKLDALIDQLRKKGYRFSKIDDLLE
jgi:endoglucanase